VAITPPIVRISPSTPEINLPKTTPLGPIISQLRSKRLRPDSKTGAAAGPTSDDATSATNRQKAQLPAFVPLLEELEVAGWSSHRRMLSGNFHDWFIVEGRTLLVMVGQAAPTVETTAIDPIEAALVAQGTWASIRSHAHHASDAGELLTLAARSLWSNTSAGLQAAAIVGLIDLDGGQASIAMAGDGLTFRVRATGTEQIGSAQPLLGTDPNFSYTGHSIAISLRERLLFMVDDPTIRPAKFAAKVTSCFTQIDAESHRRMMAADVISLARDCCEPQAAEAARPAMSLAAIRRR
jgi:hypothetical protein